MYCGYHAKYPYLWLLFHAQDEARMEALAAVLGRVICKRVPVAAASRSSALPCRLCTVPTAPRACNLKPTSS